MKNNKESLYLQELAYLREKAKLMAIEFPHLKPFLSTPHDPDIERLFEGFSLLTSNLRNTIEDSYPQITHDMLGRIWPHVLRPVPPTTIIQFTPHQGIHQGATDIPQGAPITTAEREKTLRFRTCRPLHIEPFMVLNRQIQKTREYSEITLTLRQTGAFSDCWQVGLIQFFLGTDRKRAALLSLWLERHLDEIYLRTQSKEKRLRYARLHGCDANFHHSILPTGNNHFDRLQRMTEYYCLPHAFDFITVDALNYQALPLNRDGSFELAFRLEGELPLETLGDAFQLGCVPAVHLETMSSQPIPLEENNAHYTIPLLETERLFQLQGIQTVKQPAGKHPHDITLHFQPVTHFCEKSGWLHDEGQPDNLYFQPQLATDLLGRLQNRIHFLDTEGKDTIHLPSQTVCAHFIGYHTQAMTLEPGDITEPQESVPSHLRACNITPVSPDFPPMVMGKSDWSLIGVLNNTPFLLFNTASLKDFLRLYDCYTEYDRALSRRMQQHIDGIVHIETLPGSRLDHSKRGQGRPINGNTLHLYLDPACYENDGVMYQFCRVIDQLLACFVVRDNFILLEIYRQDEQAVLWTFSQRVGLRSEM
ncbi:type VI secretion system baseplate subunit TssF [Xenorhabdus sp. Flor]|uniref:type VI secretion system baseplate subunit TssF n=1 Tax=Xenorhabdus cabanillasii TaxID=351673 RepID=UPI0019C2ED84|nr:type VI secretion system baseplate subunit TssF [Xenorhabdus sp. Flor]MBD2816435.1 type VI secretion system baseplate subunit TssF [Xenorhabdus sp. Flor]